ncbi:hypothetical protein A2631_05685 [Candidatus Daviesbacteria bacterium RIFCSPHIGHO2_01_FULL_44_29]|uniref:Uncharacterized protein n=1 Tax=Candidatus Daviesbacteria bacterium RIFCSPHIGHO2_02_FULL_43_12 TaxID=1797776 RepID=A0A1F5KI95_9BACT|nr:MAG: hypothetical protein A2631_05685 [Candidatus Daviesbacteria bacterium RIFCSPHIGHO2_01_FULL_44_29]OGE39704.1 MAG: hypothetical protein A3E86_00200 [Candidatus Daviesbacteria bacterium RIFCSPHIGHO2_12_FULL_47_45]OGE40656.1 MAG: hypothetical protein A3D25_05870 [Candidatus Daviesbacteria bacterium RIFCSPHIGHO2_02_FULL_43_12]OGE69848.1 MAG: hypothetical protein A3B55_05560 [Candidatus Daviesbacteria bacterium RIFCSPLOWO2_01_FULL_43_15]
MSNFRVTLFAVAVAVVSLTAILTVIFNNKEPVYKPGVYADVDRAVNQAKLIYNQAKSLGQDLSSGPCLSNALLPGWVVDIAHNPRLPIDDLPENQCSAIREGQANHFVELDPDGKLIKVK